MIVIKILIVLLIAFIIWKLENSPNFNSSYSNKFQKLVIYVLAILAVVIIFNNKPVAGCNYLNEKYDIYSKYLVDALLDGKVDIDIEPSPALNYIQNPYDPSARKMWYPFDTAYYNKNFYVYFGVVPAVLLFIPYTLFTGAYLNTHVATTIFMILSIFTNIALTIEICKRWFKEIPFKMLLLFIISGLFSGLYMWIAWRMWLYELTLISGFFFVQLGLLLMIKATNEKEIKLKFVTLSCLSMALAVGCRPTLVFASALLLPFMWDILKRKDKKKAMLAMIIPYVVVAIPLMIYNYARFGNILEFGAKYQLTVIDGTNLSERYKDIPKGLYQYLIKFPDTIDEFPYIKVNKSKEGFTDNYYNGGIISGILFLNLSMISIVLWIKYFKKNKDKILKWLMIILPVIGFILTIVVIMAGGSIQRYAVDFFWMFSTLSMIIWALMYENAKDYKSRERIFRILLILILLSIFTNIFGTFFCSEYDYLKVFLQEDYNFYKELFHFIDFN